MFVIPPPPVAFVIPPPPPVFAIPPPPAPAARPRAIMDIECYIDYFLVKFYDIVTREFFDVEMYEGRPLNITALQFLMQKYTVATFNGIKYDLPILAAAMCGHGNANLKHCSDAIIKRRMQPWQFEREFKVVTPSYFDGIDLIEVSPGIASLKLYAGKMHSRKMQDLPIDPSASISPDQRMTLLEYCGNDLLVTLDLLKQFADQVALREMLGARYGVDLRSKSDAQVAETVIKLLLGFEVQTPFIPHGFKFNYQVPSFVKFTTPDMQALLDTVARVSFVVSDSDQVDEEKDEHGVKIKTGVIMPHELKSAKIKLGNSTYKLGIGGLHSTEESTYHTADDDHELSDHDVKSYYPFIIINQRLYPPQMGEAFLKIYEGFTRERVAAKDAGDKKTADMMKIMINGTFGKLGSKYSKLYAPSLLIQTTITGQLCLLMLIEMLEVSGISVVSANTDGIVLRTPKSHVWLRGQIIAAWEAATNFETEVAHYSALYSRDVNSYIALKPDGTVKLKGAYAPPVPVGPSWPNPTAEICTDAVIAYLQKGVPLGVTIAACTDIRKFVSIRNVKGGGEMWYGREVQPATNRPGRLVQLAAAGWVEYGKDVFRYGATVAPIKDAHALAVQQLREAYPVRKEYLGKAVRWYYCTDRTGAIHYTSNGNLVATTEGARPCMELPDALPADIDYEWYAAKAASILDEIGLKGWH